MMLAPPADGAGYMAFPPGEAGMEGGGMGAREDDAPVAGARNKIVSDWMRTDAYRSWIMIH